MSGFVLRKLSISAFLELIVVIVLKFGTFGGRSNFEKIHLRKLALAVPAVIHK